MNNPLITVLSFSGGKQSSCLLWMILFGDIQKPKNFLVLNADPGMENSGTYIYVQKMKNLCQEQNIPFFTVPGKNLYKDIVNLKNTPATRFDNPPYWMLGKSGKIGRLKQKCTYMYKIAPMDRFLRSYLWKNFGISKKGTLREKLVEKWIGFTSSELERIKPSKQKYIYFSYPLIDLKMSNKDVLDYYLKHNLVPPPRSVCNACFANGLETFKEMFHSRPEDWKQAVNVDNSIRDWKQIGVKNPVYVSNTLIPLEKLAEQDFDVSKIDKDLENDYSCDSGYCFL